MRTATQLVIVAALALVAAAGWYFKDHLPLGGGGEAAAVRNGAPRAVPVEVAEARSGEVRATVEAVGTARANEAIAITSKVAGLVTRIAFEEGQKVEAGTVLVELDATELQARLAEARATRDNARQLLQRAQQLLASRNVPQARVDELQSQLDVAEARVRASEAVLGDYLIRAPFGGRLGLRQVSLGALVRPGEVITTLDDSSIIKLEFEVPEIHLGTLEPGRTVTARSAAFPGRSFEGRVSVLDSRIDPATRAVRVRAEIANPDETLKPGMFLSATLVTGYRPDAVLIPEEAVMSSSFGHFVFIVRDGRAARVPVALGQRNEGWVEVAEGVSAGAVLVVGGLQQVRDGAAVRVVPTIPSPAATS